MEVWFPSASWIASLRSEQLYIFGKDTKELTFFSFFFTKYGNLTLTTWTSHFYINIYFIVW